MTIKICSTKKGQQVTTSHVDTLIQHYKKERWLQNSKQLGKADSLSTWYGLDELFAFLQIAKSNEADGIKIYYGVYPTNYETPELRGRQTVVLVATKQKETENGKTNKNIYIQTNGKQEILAFNLGQACPPWCIPPYETDETFSIGFVMEKIGLSILDDGQTMSII